MFDFNNGTNFNPFSNVSIPGINPESTPNTTDELGATPLENTGNIIQDNDLQTPSEKNVIGTETSYNIVIRKFPAFRGLKPQKFVVHYRYSEGQSMYYLKVERHEELNGKNVKTVDEGWRSFPMFHSSSDTVGVVRKTTVEIKRQAEYSARISAIVYYTQQVRNQTGLTADEARETIVIPFIDGTKSTAFGVVGLAVISGAILVLMGLR
jgi:hypothetical protein